MPGPLSVPNGDSRILRNDLVCATHGEQNARCQWDKGCAKITLREFLFRRNRLVTGKTRETRRK